MSINLVWFICTVHRDGSYICLHHGVLGQARLSRIVNFHTLLFWREVKFALIEDGRVEWVARERHGNCAHVNKSFFDIREILDQSVRQVLMISWTACTAAQVFWQNTKDLNIHITWPTNKEMIVDYIFKIFEKYILTFDSFILLRTLSNHMVVQLVSSL